ncbi:hypothetical protein KGF57_002079 [Candida theae]|uniref:Uncharacterized protein n=1 Tax=Candida theae TaxID=1198502 RepID=A0AAD5BFN3_9ASCO|nr:uncharacterized protein KGF57_002079 [Candida theae]KAI5959441.1 hypothetical protein KGF57_002079 [Candida theae]
MLPITIFALFVKFSHQSVINAEMQGGYPNEPAARTIGFDPYSNVTPLNGPSSTGSLNSTSTTTMSTNLPSSSTSKGDAPVVVVPLAACYLACLLL